ncbi:ROK family transcriptional regulator [Streptomyces sp. NPDC090053]|uniref:ROK family transcriptional regulator n=1 Tax=Streptomyces sp. NPDC090053 TaxID=3365932 RepID=UPI003806BD5A
MTSSEAATGPHVLRRINERVVLEQLRVAASLRLSELMESTGLSRPAVARAVASLTEAGWLQEVAESDQPERRLGRPAQRVRFCAERGHVLGIDAGPHNVRVCVADLAGRAVADHKVEKGSGSWAAADVLAAITRCTDEALERAGLRRSDIWSVGVGTPGIVDEAEGTVTLAPSIHGWAGLSVGQEIRAGFDCPVYLDNEANLSALAESWSGVAAGTRHSVFVQWGARIGLGIVIDGKLHRGGASGAGELGFVDLAMPPDADEPPVPRSGAGGNEGEGEGEGERMGAFERLVGAAAIVELAVSEAERAGDEELRRALTTPDQTVNAGTFFAAASRGDNAAVTRTVERVAGRFARGIAVAALVLDPDLIVIGGGVSQCGAPLLAAIERRLRPRLLTAPRLELSALGARSVATGGIRRALDEVQARWDRGAFEK